MSDEHRFWSKVDKSGECWTWKASVDLHGYGRFGRSKGPGPKVWKAHRYAYESCVGPIPDGLHVLHSCDNPPCCNPAHLRVGTPKDNGQDRVERHRSLAGERHNRARLRASQVAEIRAIGLKLSGADLARRFGVSQATISMIRSGKVWGSGVSIGR